MKNLVSRHTTAVLVALCLSACAHDPSTSTATSAAKGSKPFAFTAPSANAAPAIPPIPPEVLATCQQANAEMASTHLDAAAQLMHQCLASHSLPIQLRVVEEEGLVAIEMARHHDADALDAQLTANELMPVRADVFDVLTAKLYRMNHRDTDAMAMLTRVRAAHEATHDMDKAVPAPYYYELGMTLGETGHPQEAIDALTHGIAMQPAGAEFYLARAKLRAANGDAKGAHSDYVAYARWTTDASLDASSMRATLKTLGIDPLNERRRPFGAANPLQETELKMLADAQRTLQSAATPQAQAEAENQIAIHSDSLGRREEALRAIDHAIALAPGSIDYPQCKVTILIGLKRYDDAIALAAPIVKREHDEASSAAKPAEVYAKYLEVSGSLAYAYLAKHDWADSIDAMVDRARGSTGFDQDYLATMYLYERAKSDGTAPSNAYFDGYIQRHAQFVMGDYRRALLLYMQGRASLDIVYAQLVLLNDPLALENGLAETWFMAAAYQGYMKHDVTGAHAYLARIDDLQPYGTNEWMVAKWDLQ